MLGNSYFYNSTIRRMVSVFGTLFNEIDIHRTTKTGAFHSSLSVPISYGPKQKYIARIKADPDLTKGKHQNILPRMSFELTDIEYDTERAINKLNRITWHSENENTSVSTQFMPVPYNFNFQLSIISLNVEDGTRIIEQILPFFTPEFVVAVQVIEDFSNTFDIPIILESTSFEDVYEGDFETRRALIWTLDFRMKSWLFGPTSLKKVIRQIDVGLFDDVLATDAIENLKITLGLEGVDNVDPSTVNETDNWRGVVTITPDDTNA